MKSDVLENAPPTGARFESDTEVARLVEVLTQQYHRIDADVNKLRNSRLIESATGLELERKAREVGINRPDGEGDDTFRRRALAGRTRAKSQATYEEFAHGVLQFLDAGPSDVELTVDYTDELGAVIVEVSSSIIDEAPFTVSTIERYLEGMIPMDRRVVIRTTDGFQFSSPSTTGDKSGKGFGDGAWTE